jgi:hypothetical protein
MLHPQGQQSDGSAGNGPTDARLWAGQQITPMQLQQLQQMQQQQRSNPDLLGNNNPPAQVCTLTVGPHSTGPQPHLPIVLRKLTVSILRWATLGGHNTTL